MLISHCFWGADWHDDCTCRLEMVLTLYKESEHVRLDRRPGVWKKGCLGGNGKRYWRGCTNEVQRVVLAVCWIKLYKWRVVWMCSWWYCLPCHFRVVVHLLSRNVGSLPPKLNELDCVCGTWFGTKEKVHRRCFYTCSHLLKRCVVRNTACVCTWTFVCKLTCAVSIASGNPLR